MIDYCKFELDLQSESDGYGWWLMIGWDKQSDGTMFEEWIFFPVTDEELETYNLTEESWK